MSRTAWLVGAGLAGVVAMLLKATVSGPSAALQAFAQAIAGAEGFGTPGAVPTTHHNPGDLTDATGAIRMFASDDDGWQALYAQLELIAGGGSRYYRPDMTIGEFANVYTATEVPAWTANVVFFLRQQGYTDADASSSISVWLS